MINYWFEAFDFTIGHEGGYVNNPNDPGGETNYGICGSDLGARRTGFGRDYARNARSGLRWIPARHSRDDSASMNRDTSSGPAFLVFPGTDRSRYFFVAFRGR